MPRPKPGWRVLRDALPLSVLAPLAIAAVALHPLSSPYRVTPLIPGPDAPAPDLVLSSTPSPWPSPLRRYEPLIGWYDDTQHQVDQTIDQAANAGLTFFAFDWYDLALSPYATDRPLNDGLRFYLTSPQRTRLKFCIVFVDQAPFV